MPARRSAITTGSSVGEVSWPSGIPWIKLVLVVAVVYGAWVGLHRTPSSPPGVTPASLAGKFSANPSTEQLAALATSTTSADVLMYSAPRCSNCAAAKGWLAPNLIRPTSRRWCLLGNHPEFQPAPHRLRIFAQSRQ